jgi:hypothetical protein
MARASWLSGEAAARQRRPVPVAVVPEPEPPPVVVEPVTVRPAPKPAAPAPADLPTRLAQALEVPVEPPGAYAGAGAHRRANKLQHALDTAGNALRRAAELAL